MLGLIFILQNYKIILLFVQFLVVLTYLKYLRHLVKVKLDEKHMAFTPVHSY